MDFLEKFVKDIVVESLTSIFTTLISQASPEHRVYVSLAIIALSFTIITLVTQKIIRAAYREVIKPYLDKRQSQAKSRIENPGAFAWGNRFLRAPLVLIGTDIYSFSQLTNKAKLLRYLKFASIVVPTVWVSLGMTIFVATSDLSASRLDIAISAAPILLAAATIFTLDLSIICDQGGNKLRFFRFFCAIVTGYVFSSIPLNYYFKSSIDSYLKEKDTQVTSISSAYESEIAKMKQERWYISISELQETINRQSKQLEDERLGNGVSKTPNSPYAKNPKYNEIKTERESNIELLEDLKKTHKTELDRISTLNSMMTREVSEIKKSNNTDHIKRHSALWDFALSTPGNAAYFLAILIFFWVIDSLAVITSFAYENEYSRALEKHQRRLEQHFDSDEIWVGFMPFTSTAH